MILNVTQIKHTKFCSVRFYDIEITGDDHWRVHVQLFNLKPQLLEIILLNIFKYLTKNWYIQYSNADNEAFGCRSIVAEAQKEMKRSYWVECIRFLTWGYININFK